MTKKLKNNLEAGFTFIELASSMTIMSIVLVSLLYISGQAYALLNREFLREDVQHYANTVMDWLSDELLSSRSVDLSFSAQSRKITCNTINGVQIITSDREKGILINGQPFANIRFNPEKKGRVVQFELSEFDCDFSISGREGAPTDLTETVFDIKLGIDLVYNKGDRVIKEHFPFRKQVFSRAAYINL